MARNIKPEFRAPLRPTPGYGVIGFDRARVIAACAKSINDRAEAGEKRMREQRARWRYEERECLVMVVKRKGKRWTAESATDVAGEGTGIVVANVAREASLETEARYQLAQHYYDRKLVESYDQARERAAKVTLLFEKSVAHGSKS